MNFFNMFALIEKVKRITRKNDTKSLTALSRKIMIIYSSKQILDIVFNEGKNYNS